MSISKALSQHRYLIIVIIVIIFWLSIGGTVLAQGTTTPVSGPVTDSLSDMAFNLLGSFLNILYILTLPVLIIAGKAMDNSMIYGEFMNLDKPLYMLWNMSRTFANFAIGWVLLWKIFMYIFKDWSGNAPAILKDLVLKGIGIIIGINISWFAIGALLDLSTIATYSLGAMPLGAIKEVNKENDMPILGIMSFFDYQSTASASLAWTTSTIKPHLYYKRGNISIPQCAKLENGIVIGPEYYPSIPGRPEVTFAWWRDSNDGSQQYCALTPQTLANITALEQRKRENIMIGFPTANNDEKNLIVRNILTNLWNSTDCSADMTVTGPWNTTWTIVGSKIMELSSALQFGDGQKTSFSFCNEAPSVLTISRNAYNETWWQAAFLSWGQLPYSSQESKTLHKLINQSDGMVGPFVMLYMTLLNFSNLSNIETHNASLYNSIGWFIEFGLKAAISVGVFIPLVALAGILILRVILLWGIIAFIPLGIVLFGLGEELKDIIGKSAWDGIKLPSFLGWWTLDAKWIIWLIFAPVIPVFTISISIIILQTLQGELSQSINSDNAAWQFFGITSNPSQTDPNLNCIDFWWLQENCYISDPNTPSGSGFANLIPWLFINIFGIGLMWMMVQISLKSSGAAGWVWEKIMNLWKGALGMIKIPGLGIGANTLASLPKIAERTIDEKIYQSNSADMEKLQSLWNKEANKETSWTTSSPTSNTWLIIKNKDAVKTNFLSSAPTLQKASNTIENRINHFGQTLEKHDTDAYQQFTSLQSTEDKSLALLQYINEIEDKSLDTWGIVTSVLKPKLEKIENTTNDQEKQKLQWELKSYLENNNLWSSDTLINLFANDPIQQKILKDSLSPKRDSNNGQITDTSNTTK